MDLFTSSGDGRPGPGAGGGMPLAARMRPETLDDIVGQTQVLGDGTPLRSLLAQNRTGISVILWGPPGTGKTTLARVIANSSGARFEELSAVSATVREVRAVIKEARARRDTGGPATVLFIDEVHRFSKTQQDALLPAVEMGTISLIGATTENPSFSVIPALLSRSLVLPLHSLTEAELRVIVERALGSESGLGGEIALADDAMDQLIRVAGGDARRALTLLEAAATGILSSREFSGLPGSEPVQDENCAPVVPTVETAGESAVEPDAESATVTLADIEAASMQSAPRYDRGGNRHYDVASALIKSIRGSDVDAALHYLAVMLEAGEDPRFITRRLMISASEDIGLADPSSLSVATAAHTAVSSIGMPEARIVLAQATIHLALAPKSNAAYAAINEALADVRSGRTGEVPGHLRDASSKYSRADGAGQGYRYPHQEQLGVSAQQYAPDEVAGRIYYRPTGRGAEARAAEAVLRLREILPSYPPDQ